jgi:hypothetical protein
MFNGDTESPLRLTCADFCESANSPSHQPVAGKGLSFQKGLVTLAAAKTILGTAIATVLSWSGFVDRECPPIRLVAVQGLDGRLGMLVTVHLDKAEAFRAARIPVHDDLGGLNRAVRFE